ncbi:transposase IS66 family protein [Shigella flexneri K-227]|uniref:ISSfl3 OrfC n=7 Tax=Enterobacteriaceae TaxID=543 RepID=A0A376NRF2_ECOLX|nr:transposase IS66 family protein [Shigella flexneri K-227]EGW97194.1 transposase IS66 family protein [Escherichia coli G58-1]OOO87274.1 transposase [Shigella dysenteriae]STD86987.1 ISSfl3 OrfC [Escherichia coli]SUJ41841.1 putative IS orf, fragment [Shigella flexneri]
MPAHILPESAVESSVIAQVVISKYTDHLPLYRQQHIFSRMGVELPVSTMADMVGVAGAALAPLAKLLRHELLTRDVIHADETSLRLLDTRKGGKSCSGWLCAYVSGERSGPPVVCFDSQTGRALRYPETWLQCWCGGTLVSDGYSVYKSLADNHPGITSACCWSHAGRGFANLYKASREPRAGVELRKIAGLYRIEKLIRERPVEKIRQWR